ncbi:alpha-glucosidases, family 31 of glycosyl hydrolases [Candidatus Scalindua japonica]|uniref:Alpha-glucosidases, family 31 of glycosyl hydrolases n=1 Tax=Candidatus Scalindua japonica TaxID=1284222 RepID=A0A286TW60_9BACT|nr:hypothetical protein [Candidatus Scalindua japonica]GAX60123.1 alpha-glucosidases, family 31 of glycosyl hydrolases [Candidatus Scalindua japonica]
MLKWKLILVGVLGSTGLGLEDSAIPSACLILCIIPFVCVYVDLHCTHLWLQIHVIGEYLRRKGFSEYEVFAQKAEEQGFFSLEKYIIYWSTIFFSAASSAIGIILTTKSTNNGFYITSGCLGIAFSLITYYYYKIKMKKLSRNPLDN